MNIKKSIRESFIGKRIWSTLYEAKKVYLGKREEKRVIALGKKTCKHILYCGICESSNMGDIAQTFCTLNWFKENYPDYTVLMCKTSMIMKHKSNFIYKLKKILTPDDLIFFQSGYNTHDLGGLEDLMHQVIIREFKDVSMIMLPQTVFFQTESREKQCSEVYNTHKKLLFFARDPISFEYSKKLFPDIETMLYPDIVTTLIGSFAETHERKGIYICKRNDIEQFYKEEDYLELENKLKDIDEVHVSDTIISVSNRKIYKELENYVSKIVKEFSKYRVIVTDKFHGLIFSLVANTPVIVMKTKDHKVTSGYEWFSKIYPDRVFYAENICDVEGLIRDILKKPAYSQLNAFFKDNYYSKLRDVITEWSEKNNENMSKE